MTEQKFIEAALWRNSGIMEPEAAASLNAFCEAQTDWWAICQVCGKRREGSLAQLRKPCTHEAG